MIVTPGDVSWRGAEAERDKETVREGSSRGGGAHGRWNEAEQGKETVREGGSCSGGGAALRPHHARSNRSSPVSPYDFSRRSATKISAARTLIFGGPGIEQVLSIYLWMYVIPAADLCRWRHGRSANNTALVPDTIVKREKRGEGRLQGRAGGETNQRDDDQPCVV